MKPYKIYTLYYGARPSDTSQYLEGDTEAKPITAAYYMWLATNGEEHVIIDLGYNREVGSRRDRQIIAEPAELFDRVKVDPKTVKHAIVTHLHWDHSGNYALFPNARFYLQEKEMAFWNSSEIADWKAAVEEDDLIAMVRLHFNGRLGLCQPVQEIVPGITVHHVGGHTRGIQVVEVATEKGTAVVASDAVKLYRNLAENRPSPKTQHVPEMMEGFKLVRSLAAAEELVLPGHDVTVMDRLPQVADNVVVAG